MKFQLPLLVLVATSNALKLPIHRVQPSAKKIDSSKKDVLELWTTSPGFIVDVNVSSSILKAFLTFGYSDLMVVPEDVKCFEPDYIYLNFTEDTSAEYCSYHGVVDTNDFTIDSNLPSHTITFEDEVVNQIYYAKANVSIGSEEGDIIQLEDFTFGVMNTTNLGYNYFGIGLPGGQFSNSKDYDEDDYFGNSNGVDLNSIIGSQRPDGKTYDGLLASLKNSGQIDKENVSLYWDEDDYGTLVVGEDDEDAYEGQLNTVPLINTYARLGYDSAPFLAANVESYYFDGKKSFMGNLSCYIFPETLNVYLPGSIFNKVNESVGGSYVSELQDYIAFDCGADISDLTFTVEFANDANLTFALEDFVSLYSLKEYCFMDIYRSQSGMGLGYPALKNYYVSFDYEDETFLFASRRTLVELEDDDSEFGGMDSESSSSSSKTSSTRTSTTRTSTTRTSTTRTSTTRTSTTRTSTTRTSSSTRSSSRSTDTEESESTGTTEEESESTRTTQEDSSESSSPESSSDSSSTSSELGLALKPSSFVALCLVHYRHVTHHVNSTININSELVLTIH